MQTNYDIPRPELQNYVTPQFLASGSSYSQTNTHATLPLYNQNTVNELPSNTSHTVLSPIPSIHVTQNTGYLSSNNHGTQSGTLIIDHSHNPLFHDGTLLTSRKGILTNV